MPPTKTHLYGGQAVIEGVMIRGASAVAVAVRDPQGIIRTTTQPLPSVARFGLRRVPLIRGLLVLVEMLIVGTRALNYSAGIAAEEESPTEGKKESTVWDKVASIFAILVGTAIAVALFVVAPTLLSDIFKNNLGWHEIYVNLVEGAVRLILIVGYLYGIGLIKSVKRLYAYHGAEHKTLAAYEAGITLEPDAIKKFPKEHPRCGTAFIITLALLAVVVFTFIPRVEPLILLILMRLLITPLLAGLAYELLRITALTKWRPLAYVMSLPGLMAQKLTTNEPDDAMIEVAIASLKMALEADSEREN